MASAFTLRIVLRPLLTAQASVAVSMLVGDTACQYITRPQNTDSSGGAATGATILLPPSPMLTQAQSPLPSVTWLRPHLPLWLNPQRSLVMLVTGLCVSGPYSALNFAALEFFFPGRSTRAVACKVLAGAVTSPIAISLVFSTITLLEGRTLAEAQGKVARDLGSTWLTGATYWPLVSALNFRFVPLHYRPLFSSLAGSAWGTYMSAQAHKRVDTGELTAAESGAAASAGH